ncbi:hypothetical protein WDU94_004300 [Cyamophila willieti]
MILPTEKPAVLSAAHSHYSTKKRHHCVSFCDDITVVEFECDKCPSSVSKPPICVSRNLRNTLFLPQQVSKFFDRYLPYETEQRNIRTLMSKEMASRKPVERKCSLPNLSTLDALKLTLLNNLNNLKLTIPTKPSPPPDTRDEFLSMTAKERQWLATIQIHQLSEVASIDYYFKQYMARTQPGVVVPEVSDYLKELKMNNVKKLQECSSPERGKVRFPVNNSSNCVKKEERENFEILKSNLVEVKTEESERLDCVRNNMDEVKKEVGDTFEFVGNNLDDVIKQKEGADTEPMDDMKKETDIESFELVSTESCNLDEGNQQGESADTELVNGGQEDVTMQDQFDDTKPLNNNPDDEIKEGESASYDLDNKSQDNVKQEDTVLPEPMDISLDLSEEDVKNLESAPADQKGEYANLNSFSSNLEEGKKLDEYPTSDPVKCLGKPDVVNGCLGKIPMFTVAHARQVLENKLLLNHTSNRRLEANPLLTIEYYYDLYMQLHEEVDCEKRASLVANFTSKLLRIQDVAHFMNISKGQKLYFKLYDLMEDRFVFWKAIFESLSQFFNHNKSTRPLNAFLSVFRSWLMTNSDLAHVVILATTIENILSFLIADKFGMSVISLLVICSSNVKVILNSCEEDRERWASFLTKLIQSIDHHPHVENPLVGSRKHLVQFLNAIAPTNVHLRY